MQYSRAWWIATENGHNSRNLIRLAKNHPDKNKVSISKEMKKEKEYMAKARDEKKAKAKKQKEEKMRKRKEEMKKKREAN